MTRRQPSLIFCILMDLIGCTSYALPVLGEVFDFVWAPLSAIIFFISFGGWKGAIGGAGNLIEELLPGTDIVPTFTIMWFMQQKQRKTESPKAKYSGG